MTAVEAVFTRARFHMAGNLKTAGDSSRVSCYICIMGAVCLRFYRLFDRFMRPVVVGKMTDRDDGVVVIAGFRGTRG